jgi:catechol 2,3-dioxygenase
MDERTAQLRWRPPPLIYDGNRPPTDPAERPMLHHVQLKTTRLEEMVRWYCGVLGLVVAHKGSGGAWLTNDDANHRLAIVTVPGLLDDGDKVRHAGLHHTAWEYADLDALLATYRRLKADEILPHRTVNHGPISSFYYLDPDGNSVELQVDNYGDWRTSARFFETPEFADDPYGPGIDPEAMIAAREAGASRSELHVRSYAGEFPNVRPNDRRLPLERDDEPAMEE